METRRLFLFLKSLKEESCWIWLSETSCNREGEGRREGGRRHFYLGTSSRNGVSAFRKSRASAQMVIPELILQETAEGWSQRWERTARGDASPGGWLLGWVLFHSLHREVGWPAGSGITVREPSNCADMPGRVSKSAWIYCLTPNPSLERSSSWQPLSSALQLDSPQHPWAPLPTKSVSAASIRHGFRLSPTEVMSARDVGFGH